MNLENLVTTDEICTRYKVELTFISSLQESGLIEIVTVEQTQYIHCDKMGDLEKLMRLHFDLEINLEGLEAIHHLLQQLRELQQQNIELRNRLNLYE